MPADSDVTNTSHAVGLRRLAVGFGQGLALYLMFRAFELKVWPATDVAAFQAILLPLLFAPLAAIYADGHLPRRRYFIGVAAVAGLCAVLGGFDGYRMSGPVIEETWEPGGLLAGTALMLFLAEALLLAGEIEGKRIPSYPVYFDAITKHAVQVAAGLAFVGALWLLLYLGAGLFELIKLDFLSKLIEERWFAIPITTMGLAIALHVTEARGGLVRGLRTLAHALLSWLLPVLTLMAAGFLASLPFTGLQPLWDTRFAAGLLLAVAAALIILINAVYQDGRPENQPRGIVRWGMMAAMALPAPLVVIAAHALFLRVAQYGWTSERVVALACILVGACFGLGYLAALVRGMKRLEETNLIASFATMVAIFALLTPVADPVRISVASQVARLEAGHTSPETFDYRYLRFQGGRYGAAALARMAAGEFKLAGVAERAKQAVALVRPNRDEVLNANDLALNIFVTSDRELPPSFLSQDWASLDNRNNLPRCMWSPAARCEAFVFDVNNDGAGELVLVPEDQNEYSSLFEYRGSRWERMGTLPRRLSCPDMRPLLRAGNWKLMPSLRSDIEIGGVRMSVDSWETYSLHGCPKSE
jgi:hypothetical protein